MTLQTAVAIPVSSDCLDEKSINYRYPDTFGKLDLTALVRKSNSQKINCFTRKLSRKSAILEFDAERLPKLFILKLDQQSRQILCNRVWMQGRSCGVQFLN